MATNYKLQEQDAYQCLKYVRLASGKIYEYELYQLINRPELLCQNVNIANMINEIFDLDFAICDMVESSSASNGLKVISTSLELRPVIDILLSSQLDLDYPLDRTVYIDRTEEQIDEENKKANVYISYHNVHETLDSLLKKKPNNNYISKAIEIVKTWPKTMCLDLVDNDNISDYYDGNILDLSEKFIRDFDCSRLTTSDNTAIIKNLKADKSFWFGNQISFDNVMFQGGVSFKGCIFKTSSVSFRKASFDLSSKYAVNDNLATNEITFRNSQMFIQDFFMDEVQITGDTENKTLSFEDAVIKAQHISFSKMKLNSVDLFCYQTIMKHTNIHFIEPELVDSTINFEDAIVNEIIMLNIPEIPQTSFNFRHCNKLTIENCKFSDTIILSGMNILSLRACQNEGKLLTTWCEKIKGDNGVKSYPILNSIMNNSDSNIQKAEQFILLKENFADLGQYDYEDEAFIQYMNHKHKSSPIRGVYSLLRCIGQYGISPGKVLLTMLVTIFLFLTLYFACSLLIPNAFSYNVLNTSIMENIGNCLYLSISNLVSYDSTITPTHYFTIILSITESIIGWFLLGYLSVAIVRKTLR